MVSPRLKRQAAQFIVNRQLCSSRRACKTLDLNRSSFNYQCKVPVDEEKRLMEEILKIAQEYPRYGYRRATIMLRERGWVISFKKAQRIRRSADLCIRSPKAKRKRLGQSTGLPTGAESINHVWTWDFISIVTESGTTIRIMTLIDEYTRRFLAFKAGYSLTHQDVIKTVCGATQKYGAPSHIRSDNGPEFIATKLKQWLVNVKIKTIYIDPGCPWQNPFIESFHSRFRDECLNRESFISLTEAQVVVEDFIEEYNNRRPHSSLKYLTPMNFYHQTRRENRLSLVQFFLLSKYMKHRNTNIRPGPV